MNFIRYVLKRQVVHGSTRKGIRMRINYSNAMNFNTKQELSEKTRRELEAATTNYHTTQDAVSLSVSKEGMERSLEMENPFMPDSLVREKNLAEDEKKSLQSELQEMAEELRKASKEESPAEEMGKMLEVARRIANGDRVPSKDEQALMEYNRDLYQAAKAAAVLHADEKHKTYDSMWEEEENQDTKEKLRDLEREGDSVSKSGNIDSVENTEVTTTEFE